MRLWAAVDLMGGSVVTLSQGRESEKTVWEEAPVRLAGRWQDEGADGLHIVDLDAALGRGSNEETILRMIQGARIPVQVGGGIRSDDAARRWLECGANRVVLGTMAYSSPSVLEGLLRDFGPGRVVVAADYRDGEIVTRGWTEGRGISVESAADAFERAGVTNLLTTSVGRDGMGIGPDVETIRSLARGGKRRIGVMASGGIRDAADLVSLERAGAVGAVIGRALYEGTVNLREVRRSVS